jgi:hypothetical protein
VRQELHALGDTFLEPARCVVAGSLRESNGVRVRVVATRRRIVITVIDSRIVPDRKGKKASVPSSNLDVWDRCGASSNFQTISIGWVRRSW